MDEGYCRRVLSQEWGGCDRVPLARGPRCGQGPSPCPRNVRITPGSGRRADIDGRQVRARTGREQMQQMTRELRAYSITSSATESGEGGTVRTWFPAERRNSQKRPAQLIP